MGLCHDVEHGQRGSAASRLDARSFLRYAREAEPTGLNQCHFAGSLAKLRRRRKAKGTTRWRSALSVQAQDSILWCKQQPVEQWRLCSLTGPQRWNVTRVTFRRFVNAMLHYAASSSSRSHPTRRQRSGPSRTWTLQRPLVLLADQSSASGSRDFAGHRRSLSFSLHVLCRSLNASSFCWPRSYLLLPYCFC